MSKDFPRVAIAFALVTLVTLTACREVAEMPAQTQQDRPSDFGDDVEFLREFKEVIVLSDASGQAQIAVVPDYQGRVMTSTAEGRQGTSFGWINYDLIESGQLEPHINVFGGEDRFWMGPEGGQFSIFFKAGDPFDLEHWQTPEVIDTLPYAIVESGQDRVTFRHEDSLLNYSDTPFNFRIDRHIRLLSKEDVIERIGPVPAGIRAVAFESINTLTNLGPNPWTKEGGLLSIWTLGMFRHSPATTVVIPVIQGDASTLGPAVNDSYFGEVPEGRLTVKGNHIFFKADGEYRSKIGVPPGRARGIAGSYDGVSDVLTLVQYDQPEGALDYVNSMWEIQEKPFAGDAINAYNDGPPAPGAAPLGPFYELETSSPAIQLEAGGSVTHRHRTMHFTGSGTALETLSRQTLGVGPEEIAAALP